MRATVQLLINIFGYQPINSFGAKTGPRWSASPPYLLRCVSSQASLANESGLLEKLRVALQGPLL